MSRFHFPFFLVVCLVLTACSVAPNVKELEQERQVLLEQVQYSQTQIAQLEQARGDLLAENAELKRVMTILDVEKDSRVDESTELRILVRKFAQGQIDALRDLMVQSNLLDYIGEELVERSSVDDSSVIFADFDNTIPRKGALMGVEGYFSRPTEFSLNILRQVDGRFVVVWQSDVMTISDTGLQRVRFPHSVGVEKGDVVAYDFPISAGVNYDMGTGNSLLAKRSFTLGDSIEPSALKGEEEKRAYSIGVVAILE